jgi:hypothetical protein
MWATVDEFREDIIGLCQRGWSHSDMRINKLALDAVGRVPRWSEVPLSLS